MPYQRLILLFGHENDEQGELSEIAKARCDTAVELFMKSAGNVYVLPTGAFGKNFNTTALPHSFYLSQYLKSKGVDPQLILSGTVSSNTFEDCVAARKIITEVGFNEITAVTSSYHAPRVKFILDRLFPGNEFPIDKSANPPGFNKAEKKKEKEKLKELKKNWPPRYIPSKDNSLNKMVYDEAIGEHRHYDTVSLAVVTAILVVGAFPFVANFNFNNLIPKENIDKARASVFLVGAAIDFLLLHIYWRAAHNARIARNTLRKIEIALDCRAFSTDYSRESSWTLPIKFAVTCLGMGMTLILMIAAATSWFGWHPGIKCLLVFIVTYLVAFAAGRFAFPVLWWLRQSRNRF